MRWVPLSGLVDLIGADLVELVDTRRRDSGEIERQRKLGTVEMLWLMLAVALNTGRGGLHEILRLAAADPGLNWRVTVGGFCKARKRFSPPASAVPARQVDPQAVPPSGPEPGALARAHRQGR